jgi:hypothetical protein
MERETGLQLFRLARFLHANQNPLRSEMLWWAPSSPDTSLQLDICYVDAAVRRHVAIIPPV